MTIPASDSAFRARIEDLRDEEGLSTPAALQTRLRPLLPRVTVTARGLAGEPPTWYVYRDGRWPTSADEAWWVDDNSGTATIAFDGTLTAASPRALQILGIEAAELGTRNFRSLADPAVLGDAEALFSIVAEGRDLTATVRMIRGDGTVATVDVHASRSEDGVAVIMRPADGV